MQAQVQPLQQLQSNLYHAHADSAYSADDISQASGLPNGYGVSMDPYNHPPYGGYAPQQQQQVPQQSRQHSTQQPHLAPIYGYAAGPPPVPMPFAPLAGSGHPILPPLQPMYGTGPPIQPHGQHMPPPALGTSQLPVIQERQLSYSGQTDKYRYTLIVEQQPQRARMCGFGDKDRRPITPPPCIRLVITDVETGREVDIDGTEGSFFVLQVDLWAENADREVNIVRASSSSPAVSISTATTTSFPPLAERSLIGSIPMPSTVLYTASDGQQFVGPAPHYRPTMPDGQPAAFVYAQPPPLYPPAPAQYQAPAQANQFTRNLIGSLTVNSARLEDQDKKMGYWFVLQDLSVRTEGFFRLKMNFIDVGASVGAGLNKGRAPVLAWVFSEVFQVYSAKKFPGVIESTPLSKIFAHQGIKIPIRKDVKLEKDNDGDGEGDDDEG